MPQYPKPEIRDRIHAAALRVFAARGYPDAGMAEIAREAGVSPGNLYHYAAGKEALFAEVVPDAVARLLLRLLRERVEALRGVAEVADAGPAYATASEALLAFSIAHRLQVVILLGRAAGTPYAALPEEVVARMVELAAAHFRALPGFREPDETEHFDLTLLFRAYVASLVAILDRYDDEPRIRRAVDAYARYHLAGLRAFFSPR